MLTRLATGAIERYDWVAPQEHATEYYWNAFTTVKSENLKEIFYQEYLNALEAEEDAYDPKYQIRETEKDKIRKKIIYLSGVRLGKLNRKL